MGIIYIIRCSKNNKVYVGKTSRLLETRWNEHVQAAMRGVSYPLYSAMRKYGIASFTITHLLDVSDEDLDNAERKTIVEYHSHISEGFGYNLTEGGDGTKGFKHKSGSRTGKKNSFFGRKHRKDTCEKIRLSLIKRADRLGRKFTKGLDADKKTKRIWAPGTHPMLGRHHTIASVRKMQAAHLGKKLTTHHKKAIGDGIRGLKRGPQSSDHREKLRLTRIGRSNHVKGVIQLSMNGDILTQHKSVKMAAQSVGTQNMNLIRSCCNNERSDAYGFIWKWLTTAS